MSRQQLSDTVAAAKAALQVVKGLRPVVDSTLEMAEKVGCLADERHIEINVPRPNVFWINNPPEKLCSILTKFTSFVRDAFLREDVRVAGTVTADLIEACENADELMDKVRDNVSTAVNLVDRLTSLYPAYSHEKVQIVRDNWKTTNILQLSSDLITITKHCYRTARDACAQFFELDHMNSADKYYAIFLSISGAIRNEALAVRSCFAAKMRERIDIAAQQHLAAVEKKTLHYDPAFIDESGLQPGEPLYGALDVALAQSTLFVALIDDTFHSKFPPVRELVNAVVLKKPVLIIHLPGSSKDALIKSTINGCSCVNTRGAHGFKDHLIKENDFPGWVAQIEFADGVIGDKDAQNQLAEIIYSFYMRSEEQIGKPTVHAALAANFNLPLRIFVEPVPETAPNFDQLTHRHALCYECAAELNLDIVNKLEESNMAIFWSSDIKLTHPEINEHCAKFDAMVEKFNKGGMTDDEWAAMMQLNSNLADFKQSNDGIYGFLLDCISTRLQTSLQTSSSWMNIHRELTELKCKRMKKYFMVPVFDLAAHGSDEIKSHKGISYYTDEKLREWFTHCAKYAVEDDVSDAVALLKTLELLRSSNVHDLQVVDIDLTELRESMQDLTDDYKDTYQDLFDAVNGNVLNEILNCQIEQA